MAKGVTTEWEDLQVKMGNWLPRPRSPTTEEIFQTNLEEAELIDEFGHKKANQLQDMAEEDPDLEEDEVFKMYREKRLEELKQQSQRPRFGELIEINRPMFE